MQKNANHAAMPTCTCSGAVDSQRLLPHTALCHVYAMVRGACRHAPCCLSFLWLQATDAMQACPIAYEALLHFPLASFRGGPPLNDWISWLDVLSGDVKVEARAHALQHHLGSKKADPFNLPLAALRGGPPLNDWISPC